LKLWLLKITNQFLNRGVTESRLIENTEDVSELIDIIRKGLDPLNQVKLKNKVLRHKKVAIPLIMQDLKKPQCDAFIELAIKIIHASGEDYSNEILEIIKVNQRDAYAVALLCMLLGFYENGETEKVLWDYYHYFKEYFRGETYCDGPLLGLEEMKARKKEQLFGYSMNNLTFTPPNLKPLCTQDDSGSIGQVSDK